MWNDVSSYSKGDKERKPYAWQLELPAGLRIVIVWNHRIYPGEWIFNLHPWFSEVRLGVKKYDNLQTVKSMALKSVIRQLEQVLVFAREAVKEE